MIEKYQGLFVVIQIVMGFIQVAAVLSGIESWWGLHWLVAIFIAIPLGCTPFLGAITGIMGAIKGWGWSISNSLLLFGWPFILLGLFLLYSALEEFMKKNRSIG